MKILLMTATINPRKGEPVFQRFDPEVRKQDYEKAFLFYVGYLGKGLDRIVFVENSGADLSWLKSSVPVDKQDQVELISHYGLDFPVEYGRAFGDSKIVDYAMKQSNTIKAMAESDVIIKVTGRYKIVNFSKILKKFPASFDLYCNHRNFPCHWADMYFMAWRKAFYFRCLDEVYKKLKMSETKEIPEVTFRKFLAGIKKEQMVLIPRFNLIPSIDAARGMNNSSYQGKGEKLKYFARVVGNRLLPWIWI